LIAISISTQSRDDPGKYIFEGKVALARPSPWQGTVQGHNIESLELLTDDESGLLLERYNRIQAVSGFKISDIG